MRLWMNRRLCRCIAWTALALLNLGLALPGRAAAYYVSADGNDVQTGMSPGQAWQSLAHAGAQAFLPGDRILLRGGDTFAGSLTLSSSGTDAKPITLGAYGKGRPILQAGNGTGVLVQNAGGWFVKDLQIVGAGTRNQRGKRIGVSQYATR